jgi:uncharacterized protein YcfJ
MRKSSLIAATLFTLGTAAAQAHMVPVRYDDSHGRVVSIHEQHDEHRASGGGALLGALAGGVIGHQIGSGTGNTVATVGGAVAGGVAGNEIEKRHGGSDFYRITVRFNDGHEESYDRDTVGDLHVGDRVRVDGGNVERE